jgi:hypothetical protein
VGDAFRECVSEYGEFNSGCELPKGVWAQGSRNSVPVADEHAVRQTQEGDRRAHALKILKSAQANVLAELDRVRTFDDTGVNVLLFSAEGDSLHQIFDCFVQGPYARVDFWGGAEVGLEVPYWARDAGGLGISRKMDLPCGEDKLEGDYLPPFTCGSPTRRAIIKYFVRNTINDGDQGTEFVRKLVEEKIVNLTKVWGDITNLQCTCDYRTPSHSPGSQSMDCCKNSEWDATGETKTVNNTYLSDRLASIDYDRIDGDQVTRKVIEKLPGFWKELHTTHGNAAFTLHDKHSVPPTPPQWRWEDKVDSAQSAVRSGLFRTFGHVMQYSEAEIGSPFLHGKTIWDMCTGLMSQTMFTSPMLLDVTGAWTLKGIAALRNSGLEFDPAMNVNFDGDPEAAGSGKTMLERYVQKLLEASYDSSPLFWHHAMRYLPSESMLCQREDGYEHARNVPARALHFSNSMVNVPKIPVPALDDLPAAPMHGYAAFPLGSVGSDCLCGWQKVNEVCHVPAAVCVDLPPEVACNYSASNSAAAEQAIVDHWGSDRGWECPDSDLSDAWGLVPDGVYTNTWTQSLQRSSDLVVPVHHLLGSIRGGVGVGNLGTIAQDARPKINPSQRVHQHRSSDGQSSVALQCRAAKLATIDLTSVSQKMVQDLFPVSQGVPESPVTSSCLRMAIEYSKVRIMEMLHNTWPDKGGELPIQRGVLVKWKNLCASQLNMMGMCKSHGVFKMVPAVEKNFSCPFTISDAYSTQAYYVTPGCLVYNVNLDRFYDPCLVSGCNSNGVGVTLSTVSQPAYAVPFDARGTSLQEAIGTWPSEFFSTSDANNVDMEDRVADLYEHDGENPLPFKLLASFPEYLVKDGGKHAPGYANVPETHSWARSEGPPSTASTYCDAMADW